MIRTIRQHFQGVTWQQCQTHFLRNLPDATPKALRAELHVCIRECLCFLGRFFWKQVKGFLREGKKFTRFGFASRFCFVDRGVSI
ncbi:transposase [Thermoactinomyces mirandus]|uniref:transposase n=1 Tax=Thermoactinomyces mirandus TaxID=2756294 RepID=UPI0035E45817